MVPELAYIVSEIEQTNNQYNQTLADSLDLLQAWINKTRMLLEQGRGLPSTPPEYPIHPFAITDPKPAFTAWEVINRSCARVIVCDGACFDKRSRLTMRATLAMMMTSPTSTTQNGGRFTVKLMIAGLRSTLMMATA